MVFGNSFSKNLSEFYITSVTRPSEVLKYGTARKDWCLNMNFIVLSNLIKGNLFLGDFSVLMLMVEVNFQ